MWLSKRSIHEPHDEDAATLGTVTIGGADAAIVTDTEQRRAKIITPGGYCWQPSVRDSVLVIKGNELYVSGMLQERTDGLAAGEVRIFSNGASITIKNNGRVEIDGSLSVDGELFVHGQRLEVP